MRETLKGPGLAASVLLIALLGSEARASRIAASGANPGGTSLSDFTPAELRTLREEQAGVLDSRVAHFEPIFPMPHGPFRAANPGPQAASPGMRGPIGLPATFGQVAEGTVGPADLTSLGLGASSPLKPPVAWHVAPSSTPGGSDPSPSSLSPRPPGLDLQYLTPATTPEPSTIVMAVVLVGASAWRARARRRAPG